MIFPSTVEVDFVEASLLFPRNAPGTGRLHRRVKLRAPYWWLWRGYGRNRRSASVVAPSGPSLAEISMNSEVMSSKTLSTEPCGHLAFEFGPGSTIRFLGFCRCLRHRERNVFVTELPTRDGRCAEVVPVVDDTQAVAEEVFSVSSCVFFRYVLRCGGGKMHVVGKLMSAQLRKCEVWVRMWSRGLRAQWRVRVGILERPRR